MVHLGGWQAVAVGAEATFVLRSIFWLPRLPVQRIIRGQYSVPPEISLSPACLDILRRMFVRDPVSWLSVAQTLAGAEQCS